MCRLYLFLLAPVSSLRLKYVYKSAGVKDEANTTKQANLIESLTNSEVNLISCTFFTDIDSLNWPIKAVFWGRVGEVIVHRPWQSAGCDGCVVIKPFQKPFKNCTCNKQQTIPIQVLRLVLRAYEKPDVKFYKSWNSVAIDFFFLSDCSASALWFT